MKRFICLLIVSILVLLLFCGCNNSSNISLNTDNRDAFDTNVSNSNSSVLEETDDYPDKDANPASDFEYTVRQDGEFVITKYIGNDESVIIPRKIDGKAITVLGETSFAGSNIVSVIMPNTVKYISSRAFVGCEKLKDIKMSSSLITIAYGAFLNCISLSSIDLSKTSTKYIDDMAFSGCHALKTVKFGDNIELIDTKAFFDCTSLEEIILPKNLKELGESVFAGCSNAKKIWIPKTITKWGYYPFQNIFSVTEIVFEEGLKTIGSEAFCYGGQMETVTIPASVEHIASGAFLECPKLKAIHFQGAVPTIGTGQFYNFVTPEEDVIIYYDSSMPGWDTTSLRDLYILVPIE